MIFRRLETYITYRIASSLLILGVFFIAIVALKCEIPTWVLVSTWACERREVLLSKVM